ncbi:AAA family ATPase [Ovoidimarina sediminis]|uniref:AAA family ATPase n=1 Tax=Ovoidimarina sediminis TaxID=3079856 RepID=UPI00290C4386|nr:AAA family ATPase [Rhodophyticola sp. MJ-SS7]MDU8945610.1 AAA family ATPase [Rhodophyticola sp. MJ-SS7]
MKIETGFQNDIDWAASMEAVARALLGEPNKHLSKPRELRFGSNGSLSVDIDNGRWFDFEANEGGGTLDLICRKKGLSNGEAFDWLKANGIGDTPTLQAAQAGKSRIVETYHYEDENGVRLFDVVRFEPKDFRQRAADGTWKVKGIRKVLYRLRQITAAHDGAFVYIVEGEKDVHRLEAEGLLATTCPGGAGKWCDNFSVSLKGKTAIVLPDNDEAGRDHAAMVKASLDKAGVTCRVVFLDGLPDKGDVSDWLDAGQHGDELHRLAARALEEEPCAETGSTFYSAESLEGKPVPSRQWLVHGLVPQKTVTLFGGDGGTGKSLLALQLAVATVAQTGWIGRAVTQGGAIFLSAEDDDDELHRRLDSILKAEGRDYGDLAGLTMRSLAGEDALLAVDTQLALMETELFRELDARAADENPALIVIDTLADVYPANENDRAKVRQFVGILRGLALGRNCAVMLLGHPSLTGLNSGSGTSGSTAWNNSVRSRLYLSRIMDDGYEPDPDARLITTKKANYGRTGDEIRLKWEAGVFRAEKVETGLDAAAASAKAERVFLKLLAIYAAQGRRVNASGGTNYAPKKFAEHPDNEGVTRRAFKDVMERLLRDGKVNIRQDGPPSRPVTFLEAAA